MVILDPANNDDNDGYQGIRDIVGISGDDDDALDKNPLFRLAENYIVGKLPDTALRTPAEMGKGRTYPHRLLVISALQMLAGAYLIRGGGNVGAVSISQSTGDVKSETTRIGPVVRTKAFDTQSSGGDISSDDRADWLEKQAFDILEGLGADITEASGAVALLTASRLSE